MLWSSGTSPGNGKGLEPSHQSLKVLQVSRKNSNMKEEWRPVVGLEDLYEVSSAGRVRSRGRVRTVTRFFPPKELKGSPATGGYKKVTLRGQSGAPITKGVHALVAEAFIGCRPTGQVVAHQNGVRDDNRLENLRFATQAENTRDRWLHGTEPVGEKNPAAKITVEDVLYIRASQKSHDELAAQFGLSAHYIKKLRKRSSWKHVA